MLNLPLARYSRGKPAVPASCCCCCGGGGNRIGSRQFPPDGRHLRLLLLLRCRRRAEERGCGLCCEPAEPVRVLAPQRPGPGARLGGQELLPGARRQEGQRRHHVERRLLRPEGRQQESTFRREQVRAFLKPQNMWELGNLRRFLTHERLLSTDHIFGINFC